MTDRLNALSPRQRECLRLVARGLEAKEIGRALGISDLTVKNHLSAARATLGVARSIDAARLVAEAEAAQPADVSGTSALWGIADRSYLAVEEPRRSDATAESGGLHDASGPVPPSSSWTPTPPLPFPTRRGQRNDLSIGGRLIIVVVLTVLLIAAVGFFVEASRGLRF